MSQSIKLNDDKYIDLSSISPATGYKIIMVTIRIDDVNISPNSAQLIRIDDYFSNWLARNIIISAYCENSTAANHRQYSVVSSGGLYLYLINNSNSTALTADWISINILAKVPSSYNLP